MKELTEKEIDYINDKPALEYSLVISKGFAENLLLVDMSLEELKESQYFIDKPLKAFFNLEKK